MLSGCVIGSCSESAPCLTGLTAISMPRPLGLSGRVTTRSTEKPACISASKLGTAKAGVPQNTRWKGGFTGFTAHPVTDRHAGSKYVNSPQHCNTPNKILVIPTDGRDMQFALEKLPSGPRSRLLGLPSPLASLHQLSDLALHQIPFQCADVADVEFAVQVVGSVTEGTGQQLFARMLEEFACCILRAYRDLLGTGYVLAKFRNAETAFILRDAAFGMNDLRVDENKLLLRVLLKSYINDRNAAGDADLRRRQADAVRSVHGFKHVVEQLTQRSVKFRYRRGFLIKHRVAKLHYGMNH